VAAAFHFALGEDGAEDALGAGLGGADLDHAAVDHDDVAGAQVLAELGVVHGDGERQGGARPRGGSGTRPASPDLELPGLLDIARADAGAGEVHEDGDLFGAAAAASRMRPKTMRTQSCEAWLMFSRKMSAPFS
jgi:hypothetical protein